MELVSVTSTQIADVSNSFVSFHSDLQLQFKNLLLFLLSCVHTFIAKVVACLLLQEIIEVLGTLYLKVQNPITNTMKILSLIFEVGVFGTLVRYEP